jgi:hypothetical protein
LLTITNPMIDSSKAPWVGGVTVTTAADPAPTTTLAADPTTTSGVPDITPSKAPAPRPLSGDPKTVTGTPSATRPSPPKGFLGTTGRGLIPEKLPEWIAVATDDGVVVGYLKTDPEWESLPLDEAAKMNDPWTTIWNQDGTAIIGCMNPGAGVGRRYAMDALPRGGGHPSSTVRVGRLVIIFVGTVARARQMSPFFFRTLIVVEGLSCSLLHPSTRVWAGYVRPLTVKVRGLLLALLVTVTVPLDVTPAVAPAW